ncbi:MAG: carbon-nitrogen hydrolase family protein [Lachnospiraceae bacterium]|nr:carbon-nitrogen hydrolase family protein [Lachnospiraceae bacterium]
MKKYPNFKAAAVQAAPVFLDAEATTEKACELISEAAANGAKLIGFPEGFISGYPWWVWLTDPISGSPLQQQLMENAVEIPGPLVKKLSECARQNNIYVCISVSEKEGGSLYLTQLWFNPLGDLIGKHRKMKPSGGERLIWGDGEASMMPVFDTEIGRLGGLQCWEHWIPLNIQAMNAQNEQVHVASWPCFVPGDEALTSEQPNEISARYYALATQSYVISCTQIHTQEIYEKMGKLPPYEAFVEFGGGDACIIGPNGKILTEKLPRDTEGIVYAQIDLEKIVDCKYQIDPAGHYSNKTLSMTVNRTPCPVVSFIGEPSSSSIKYECIQKCDEAK